MSVMPFFTNAFFYSVLTYRSTCVEVPIITGNYFARRQAKKGSEEYDQCIKTLPGYNIKIALQPFLDKMGIRKDLIIGEKLNTGFCIAQGTNFFTKGDAIILVAPRFHNVDKDACNFIIKHEISHIKNNDLFTIPLMPVICLIAAAIFYTSLTPDISQTLNTFSPILVAFSIGITAFTLFSQYRERKADDLAIAESSIEELKGGRRFFKAVKESNLEGRKTTWNKITTSPEGDIRLDLFHPSNTSRIRKVEHALLQHGIESDDLEESEKIANLKNLMCTINFDIEYELRRVGYFRVLLGMN